MPSLIKLIGTRGSSFEVTEDSYGNISHPKTIYSTVAPTASDTHPAGTRWLDSTTGTFYDTHGAGRWRQPSDKYGKFGAFWSATGRQNEIVDIAGGQTHQTILALPGNFQAVRLAFCNSHSSAITLSGAVVAPSESIADLTLPTGSFETVTFGGSGSVSLPAGQDYNPSITLSDWIPVESMARTDGDGFLLYARAYFSGDVVPGSYLAVGLLSPVLRRFRVSGNNLAGSFGSTAYYAFTAIAQVQTLSKTRQITIAASGDSITAGGGSGASPNGNSWLQKAKEAITNSTRPVTALNWGFHGATPQLYAQAAINLIDSGIKPDILIYSPFSPNGGTPDASKIAERRYWMLRVIEKCESSGIKPILSTGIANTALGWDSTADGFRLALNQEIREMGLPFIDFASVMGDGATPERIPAAFTTDGTHPNDAGYTAMSAVAIPVIQAFT